MASRPLGHTDITARSQASEPEAKPVSTSGVPDASNFQKLYYTPEEVVGRWRGRIDAATLRNWRSLRVGPPYHRFGRAVLYRLDLLEKLEEKNLVSTLTEREREKV